MQKLWSSVAVAALLLCAGVASAGEAGTVIYTVGKAEIAAQPAELGAAVNEGQLLSTGRDGFIYIRTIDQGLFILRPNSQARIDTYVVDTKNPANTRVKLELLSGVARSRSGEAVKQARQNFRFNTPVAAIGVRGTDFTVFTDQDTSRVTVLSGGITMSGFDGACAPTGSGPCEGAAARELSAAQKGLQLQVQRGRPAPQLMPGGTALTPDMVTPPRSDEPQAGKTAAAPALADVNLDPRKNVVLQERVAAAVVPEAPSPPTAKPPPAIVVALPAGPVSPEPVPVTPVPDPIVTAPPAVPEPALPEVPAVPVPPPLPLKEISWGRWAAVAGKAANVGLAKDGAERIAMNQYFALFRSKTGSDYVLPEKGSIGLALAASETYVRDNATDQKSSAKLNNGQLMFDFDKARFSTKFDVIYQASTYNMYSAGVVGKDGVFSGLNQFDKTSNMTVNGVLSEHDAAYLFQGALDARRSVTGATTWTR